MDKGLISIIMPAYNAEQFIKESINSVLIQTYRHWELIVIDDGSTDNTKPIIEEYIVTDDRIKYIYQRNGKQGKARNTGINIASGDYLAFLDADDIWQPFMLANQVTLLIESDCDLVFSSVEYINEKSEFLKTGLYVIKKEYKNFDGIKILLQSNHIPISTVLTKKKAILDVEAFKISEFLQFGEDYDLWLRMLINGSCFYGNPQFLAFYRVSPLQSSKRMTTQYLQLLTMVRDLPLNKYGDIRHKTICTLLKRSLKYSAFKSKAQVKELLPFLPSFLLRSAGSAVYYVLPFNLLKGFIYKLIRLEEKFYNK